MTSKKLVSLQFAYENKSLEDNFKTLCHLIQKSPKNSIILAPELCLSGYKYEFLDQSAEFSTKALPKLQALSQERTLTLTLIEKVENAYYNNLKVFHNGTLIYSRGKAKLFPLGDEPKYFTQEDEEKIEIIELEGIKLAFLICFELRFSELWQKIQGADVILVPAYWGKLRREHFLSLTRALAITNQAYVIASNSADKSMAKGSGIITPFGEEFRDERKQIITQELNLKEIQKMRKYINIGL